MLILRGKVIQRELRKNRFSLDELMQELRNQGVLDISKIEYGILETDGRLNVMLYASESPVTPAMLNIETSRDAYPAIIINDGHTVKLAFVFKASVSAFKSHKAFLDDIHRNM